MRTFGAVVYLLLFASVNLIFPGASAESYQDVGALGYTRTGFMTAIADNGRAFSGSHASNGVVEIREFQFSASGWDDLGPIADQTAGLRWIVWADDALIIARTSNSCILVPQPCYEFSRYDPDTDQSILLTSRIPYPSGSGPEPAFAYVPGNPVPGSVLPCSSGCVYTFMRGEVHQLDVEQDLTHHVAGLDLPALAAPVVRGSSVYFFLEYNSPGVPGLRRVNRLDLASLQLTRLEAQLPHESFSVAYDAHRAYILGGVNRETGAWVTGNKMAWFDWATETVTVRPMSMGTVYGAQMAAWAGVVHIWSVHDYTRPFDRMWRYDPTNRLPVSAISGPTSGMVGQQLQFTSTAAYDLDGPLVSTAWDFGDGTTSTTEHPTHAFTSAGTFTVRLTVTDFDGATATATRAVQVSQPSSSTTGTSSSQSTTQPPVDDSGSQTSTSTTASSTTATVATAATTSSTSTTSTTGTTSGTSTSKSTSAVALAVDADDASAQPAPLGILVALAALAIAVRRRLR